MQIDAVLCPNPRCAESSTAPSESYCGRCGSQLALDGKYRLVRKLGEGGMGRTYLAQDLRFLGTANERCVVKELKSEEEHAAKSAALFRREAGRLLDLRHPGIPSYRDFFEVHYSDKDDALPSLFMVQQFIDGEDLQVIIDRDGPMTLDVAQGLMVDTLDILRSMHGLRDPVSGKPAPLLHLDLKPQNLMLREADRQLFVIDFGISAQIQMTMFKTHGAQLSKGGFSPGFSPFEQTMGYVAPASDIFSWAMTFVVLLTAEPPTALLDPLSGKVKFREFVSLPGPLEALLIACLATHMKDRPQSISEVMDRLSDASLPVPLPSAMEYEAYVETQALEAEDTAQKTASALVDEPSEPQAAQGTTHSADAIPREKESPRASTGLAVLGLLVVMVGLVAGVWWSQRKVQPDDQRAKVPNVTAHTLGARKPPLRQALARLAAPVGTRVVRSSRLPEPGKRTPALRRRPPVRHSRAIRSAARRTSRRRQAVRRQAVRHQAVRRQAVRHRVARIQRRRVRVQARPAVRLAAPMKRRVPGAAIGGDAAPQPKRPSLDPDLGFLSRSLQEGERKLEQVPGLLRKQMKALGARRRTPPTAHQLQAKWRRKLEQQGYNSGVAMRLKALFWLSRRPIQARACVVPHLLKDLTHRDARVRLRAADVFRQLRPQPIAACGHSVRRTASFLAMRLNRERFAPVIKYLTQGLRRFGCQASHTTREVKQAWQTHKSSPLGRQLRYTFFWLSRCITSKGR